MNIMERISRLSAIPGVSGSEGLVRDEIAMQIEGCHDGCRTDALGNLIVLKRGIKTSKNKLMISAHMDEVGLIVTYIEDSGLLRFSTVGGIDRGTLHGKAVEIGTRRLPGVIGAKAAHQLSEKERDAIPNADKLFIDIGASSREEAQLHLSPGDRAVFLSNFTELGDKLIMGRAFDDRAGCALLAELIVDNIPFDCHFAFTAQEEVGCMGGETAAYAIAPDIAIVVEATTAADTAGMSPAERTAVLGGGPVLSFMDKGTVYDTELYHLALDIAREKGIPCQSKTRVAGGNESRKAQTAGNGARVMAVSLPCRYLHTPGCVLHRDDISATRALLAALIEALGER